MLVKLHHNNRNCSFGGLYYITVLSYIRLYIMLSIIKLTIDSQRHTALPVRVTSNALVRFPEVLIERVVAVDFHNRGFLAGFILFTRKRIRRKL